VASTRPRGSGTRRNLHGHHNTVIWPLTIVERQGRAHHSSVGSRLKLIARHSAVIRRVAG
jgi:hypothetical protein